MLRLLIGTGALLMAVGFGAAGWQYWQGLAHSSTVANAPDDATANSDARVWMISPTGGIVPERDARSYLVHDRLVPDRMARLIVTAPLGSLLVPGEKLPAPPYLEVLADIRAPLIARTLCPILTADLARTCVVHAARVIPGSVDAVRDEARFSIELAYRQNVDGVELPDLAAHVLRTERITPDPAVLPLPASVEAALAELAAAVRAGCSAEERAGTCRILDIEMDWAPGAAPVAGARIAWLTPLPDGFSTLAAIQPAPEG
jgi:hypothetical protein